MLNSIFKKDLSRTDFDVDGEFVTINQDTLTQKLEILVPSETTIKRLAAEVHDDKETPHRTDAEIKALALEVHKDDANEIIQTLIDAGALKAHPTTDGGIVWGLNGEHALLKDIDTTAPVITMTANAVTLTAGDAFIPLDYVTSIIDNVDGTLTPLDALTIKPATVDTSIIGDQTITYTVKDKEGNTSTATLILTIEAGSTVVNENFQGWTAGLTVTEAAPLTIKWSPKNDATAGAAKASFGYALGQANQKGNLTFYGDGVKIADLLVYQSGANWILNRTANFIYDPAVVYTLGSSDGTEFTAGQAISISITPA